MNSTRRCLMICCLVTSIIIILLVVTFVILYFTMFKPKQPQILTTHVSLQNIEFQISPPSLNISLGLDVSIRNRNYAGFKYDNTTTFIYYRGALVGLAPIEAGAIDARSTETITTVVDLQVDKIISNPLFFLVDVPSGSINLTSSSKQEGDVILVINFFKLHASTLVSCDISVFLVTRNSSFICNAKVRI